MKAVSSQYSVNMWSSENQGQKMREMREKQILYRQTVYNITTTSFFRFSEIPRQLKIKLEKLNTELSNDFIC